MLHLMSEGWGLHRTTGRGASSGAPFEAFNASDANSAAFLDSDLTGGAESERIDNSISGSVALVVVGAWLNVRDERSIISPEFSGLTHSSSSYGVRLAAKKIVSKIASSAPTPLNKPDNAPTTCFSDTP